MEHREVQYRGLWDIERCNKGTMGHREVQYRDYGT